MSDRPQGENPEPLTLADALGRVRLLTALAVLGALLTVIGSLGPWVTTAFGQSVSGVHGTADGWLTLGASAAALLVLGIARGRRWRLIVAWVAMLGALAVACLDVAKVGYAASKVTLFGHQVATTGWGLYLTVGGALLAAISLATGAVFTRHEDVDAGAKRRDLRVPALVIVALVVAGTVTGGIVHEHSLTTQSSERAQVNAPKAGAPTSSASASTSSTTVGPPTLRAIIRPTTTASTTPITASTTPGESGGSYSGVAPASSVGPATDQSSCPGVTAFSIGPETSCGFAANVVNLVRHAYTATGHYPASVTAHSPVTGTTYVLSCHTANPSAAKELDCSTSTGAEITIELPLGR